MHITAEISCAFLAVPLYLPLSSCPLVTKFRHVMLSAAHHENYNLSTPLYFGADILMRINYHKLTLFAGYSFRES